MQNPLISQYSMRLTATATRRMAEAVLNEYLSSSFLPSDIDTSFSDPACRSEWSYFSNTLWASRDREEGSRTFGRWLTEQLLGT